MNKLLNFIDVSPTAFHAVENIKLELLDNGFKELKEYQKWNLEKGNKYFVTRNGSALFAFTIPQTFTTIQMVASHLDSPAMKVKNTKAMIDNGHIRLDVERYGGSILSSWFDRPLSLAGRVVVEGEKIQSKVFQLDDLSFVVPNASIHLNREVNQGKKIAFQKEMLPIIGLDDDFDLASYIKEQENIDGNILSIEAFVYNKEKGIYWGKDKEFILAPRIDNLECTYAIVEGIVNSNNDNALNMGLFFDNEEVGSTTKQGADSSFLNDVLDRIKEAFNLTSEQFARMIASGFMISADNAHGYHPNYKELYSPSGAPVINGGIVIKHNAMQKYTSDAVSSAVFKKLCANTLVTCQDFYNNSDVLGGSTLGNIANSHISLNSVDIGLAQWAMHSSNESAGTKDYGDLVAVLKQFYTNTIIIEDDIVNM